MEEIRDVFEPGTMVIVSSELMKKDYRGSPQYSHLGWAGPMLKYCDRPVTIKWRVGRSYGINHYVLEEDDNAWTWAQSWMTPYAAKITQTEINQLLIGT